MPWSNCPEYLGLIQLVASYSMIVWRPPTDVYETPDKIIVVVELAGVSEEDMSVTLFSDLLVVEGTRDPALAEMNACHQLGIKYGEFRAEISLHAPVDHEQVTAEYKNGLLIITLRKHWKTGNYFENTR